jgi:predicted transcriptional regulator
MALKPRYADAILAGEKRVEFRKRALASDITTVLIYATMPVKRIVGEFTVERTIAIPPRDLWRLVGCIGGVHEDDFYSYYAGSDIATGIIVESARRYKSATRRASLTPRPAVPQSFNYLAAEVLHDLRRQDDRAEPSHPRCDHAPGRVPHRRSDPQCILATVV